VSDFFASGHAIDLILAVMAIEILLLVRRRRRPPADIVAGFLPGVLILLAARAALTGAGWPWIALWLGLSFPAHLYDLHRRGV
jgi:hypothetical protein